MEKQKRTLQLKWPFADTLVLALIFLALLLGLAELIARTDYVQAVLPVPTIASGHRKLDIKLTLLDNVIKEEGRVDCIFLGGSDVNAAINPQVFSKVYEKVTGKKIICFNFGLDGFIPPAAAIMAGILVKKYHPRLLIWGLSPGGFGNKFKRQTKQIVLNNPWCRYWSGDFNFEGWLTEHSYAYRYFLRFRIWLERPQYSEKLAEREEKTSRYGFKRSRNVSPFKPDPEKRARLREILWDFQIAPDAAAALEKILRLRSLTEIMVIEIPLHPLAFSLYERGMADHEKISSYISKRARHHGALFLPTARLNLIPTDGYFHINHMNIKGARIFSRWLAKQVGKVVKIGFSSSGGRLK